MSEWVKHNPELVFYLVVGVISLLSVPLDKKHEKSFSRRYPRLYALRDIVHSLGLDSPKLVGAVYRALTGKPPPQLEQDRSN